MINNIELIKPLLNFEKKGDFYMLYVFKRKKDQPEGERDNHQSVRTIKTYCIESIDHLERRYDEIIQMCEMFKARAYIHVQKQNHFDVSLSMMAALAQRIQNGNNNQKGLFDSVVGQIKTQEKRWIVDIDTTDEKEQQMIITAILDCNPVVNFVEERIYATIPTKNGMHIITSKFNVMQFFKHIEDYKLAPIDLQKKNPTLLYYPESLDIQNK
jgi:hypothetical protein